MLDGGKHLRGTRRQHRGNRAGMQQRAALQHERQPVREAGELPGEVEGVARGAVVVNQGGCHRRRQFVRTQREQHRTGLEVRRDGFPVGVPAVAADELHRVVQPGQAHRDVQGAAADVGLDT